MGKTYDPVRIDLPHLVDRTARSSRARHHRTRRARGVAFVHPLLPRGLRKRRRRHRRGRGWQPLSRFQRRHRGGRHRPLPSARGGGHPAAGRPPDPHVGHRFLLRRTWWRWPRSWPHIAPGDVPRRVSFGNSGAEAIEGAIKLARYATGRDKIIAFFGSFHGRTMGALSLTARKAVQRARLRPAGARRGPRALSLLLPLPLRQRARHLRGGVRQAHRRHAC